MREYSLEIRSSHIHTQKKKTDAFRAHLSGETQGEGGGGRSKRRRYEEQEEELSIDFDAF